MNPDTAHAAGASPIPPPSHVGIIMDGNGRWAQARGLPRLAGHEAGVENVRGTIKTAVEMGIQHLTLYAFSTENWKRPPEEVNGLLALIDGVLRREVGELNRQGVQLRHLGSLERLGPSTRRAVQEAVDRTRSNQRLIVNIAFNYGGRAELVQAARRIVARGLDPEDVTEAVITSHLSTAGQPDPDLIIRTGGEMRLSNFLLWQSAYAELYATDVFWPDFGRQAFLEAIEGYAARQRRFGGLPGASPWPEAA